MEGVRTAVEGYGGEYRFQSSAPILVLVAVRRQR